MEDCLIDIFRSQYTKNLQFNSNFFICLVPFGNFLLKKIMWCDSKMYLCFVIISLLVDRSVFLQGTHFDLSSNTNFTGAPVLSVYVLSHYTILYGQLQIMCDKTLNS